MKPMRSHTAARLRAAGLACAAAAAVALSPLAPPAAADPATAGGLVARPQHAILLLSATDTRHIWLLSLDPGRLTYAPAEHSTRREELVAKRDSRVAVKLLSGDVYAIDPRTGRFAAFDELTGRFAAVSHDEARRPQDDPAGAGPQLHTEIAEGSGATASAALEDALRNAVRQAVGVYVDSETLTNKDDIVSDKVLTASDAFVVRYTELSRSTADGLVTVEVSADIESGKLMENLRAAQVQTLDLSGADLVASALTRKESRDNAADLLYRRFCELPNVLDADVLPFNPLDYDAEKQLLTVTYTLETDRDKYAALLEKLVPLLAQTARAKTHVTAQVNPIWSDHKAPVWQGSSGRRNLAAVSTTDSGPFRLGPDLSRWPGSWCLWLLVRGSSDHRTAQWAGYVLDVDLPRTLGHVTGSMQVRLDLVTEGGETIHTETHDPLTALPQPAFWFGWARPRPRSFQPSKPRSWPPPGRFPTTPILKTTFEEPELSVHEYQTVNLYVSPLCYSIPGPGQALLAPLVWHVHQLKIPPDTLGRVRSIEATPVFVPDEPAAKSD